MREKITFALLTVILLSLFPLILVGQSTEYFNDRLIIKYESERELQRIQTKRGTDPKNVVQQIFSQNGARASQPIISNRLQQEIRQRNLSSADDVFRIHEIIFSQTINPVRLAAKISSMPGIAYAEPRYLRKMNLEPNDDVIGKFIDQHNFFRAWDESQGSRDIVIAIVDGGVDYTNIDLDGNIWVNQDEVPATHRPQVDDNNDGDITPAEIHNFLQDNNGDYNEDGTIDLQDALHNNSPFMDEIDGDNNNFTDDLFGWDFWNSGGIGNPVADNNPMHDATDHGTHVAGIAAAETNNDTAIAGAGFNTTYMPVKAGGTTDESNLIGFGFEGILYAVQNGADIINCSWSGQSSSLAEEEVIDLAFEMGALVVAAAGNESNERIDFPAGYDRVLSVGSIETSGFPALYSNYGYQLDVLATGSEILSLSYGNELVVKTGTSMSSPVVSGLAALVKEVHPDWPPDRIGMQIRTSASALTVDYPDFYSNKLGGGSINAFDAVNTNNPGLKIISHDFVNEEGEKLTLNEPGTVQITLINYGNATSGVSLQLQSLNEAGIELVNPSRQLNDEIGTGETVELSFDLTITKDFDLKEIPTLRVDFTNQSQDYKDYNVIQYDDILFDILAVNNVKMSIGSDGTIGFTDPLVRRGGVGFIPRTPDGNDGFEEGNNLLFEGGLMVEINGEMYDAVREEEGVSRDFIPQELFSVTSENGGVTGHTRFITDADTGRQAAIDLQAYAFDQAGIRNVVFLEYTVENPTEFVIMENIYVGLFNDWDIGNNPSNNSTSYDEADSVLYISDAAQDSNQPVVSVAHLGPLSSALAIDNAAPSRDSVFFGIYDGFTDGEKKGALKAGTERSNIQNADVSAVVASGPYTIEPGASVTVGFAYVFGDDVAQLLRQITEARGRDLFSVSPTGRATPEEIPPQTTLYQNYPNPFNSRTQLRLDLEQSTEVTLTVFDVLGRKVRTLADREFEAGAHFLQFNAEQLSSGTYFIRLVTDHSVQSIPVTLIK